MKAIITFCLLLINWCNFAQTVDLQFVNTLNDGTHYDIKVQIKADATFDLGDANLKFNYNEADLSNPSLGTAHNFSGGSYNTITVTKPVSGVSSSIASINIELFAPNTGSPVNTGWTDVATVRFDIDNTAGSSQLSFRSMNPPETDNPTVIFLENESDQVTQGTFSSLNTEPLPVELTSFTASTNQSAVNLKWQTITEVNNYGFEVERASSSTSPIQGWEKIGFISGHGNSNSPKDYSFMDKSPIGSSKFVYRLKQIDYDGKFEYSDEVEVELLPNEFALYQNYPNPFNPETNIKFTIPKAGNVTLSVYNILGEKVRDLVTGFMEAGVFEVSFNGTDLVNGTYFYRLQADDFVQVKKMLLIM